MAIGDVPNGQRCLAQAIAHDPSHLEARYNLGNLARQNHDFSQAIACYDSVLAQDPDHWRSLLNKAVVLTCSGRGHEAGGILKRALKLSGQGSALATEVDRLHAMLREEAEWGALNQQMGHIEATAKAVDAGEQVQLQGGQAQGGQAVTQPVVVAARDKGSPVRTASSRASAAGSPQRSVSSIVRRQDQGRSPDSARGGAKSSAMASPSRGSPTRSPNPSSRVSPCSWVCWVG